MPISPYALCLASAVLGTGAIVGWWHARRALAALRAKQAADETQRGRVIRRLEHEILNPLETICGTVELMLHGGDTTAADRSHLLAIQQASNTLLAVVRNAGTWLNPPASAVGESFDLHEALEAIMAPRFSRAIAKRLHFELHIEPCSPRIVEADAELLAHCLGNVLDHCLAITDHGHVEVTLHSASNENVSLTISNTGPPFSPQAQLFEPFGLFGHTREGNPSGTGLNLNVARLIARALGGELDCLTRAPMGTGFSLRFPAIVQSRAGSALPTGNVVPHNDLYAKHRAQVTSKRLLVVEDQASNAHVIASTLKRGGHDVAIASDGNAALLQLGAEEPFDVVIIDLGLPDIGGLDVIKLSRFHSAVRKHDVPFIVLTGETSERVRQDCFAAGAWIFLKKPMSSQRLLDAVALVCERAEHLADSNRIQPGDISLNAAHRALLSSDPSQALFENFRDMLNYQRDIEKAAQWDDWDAVLRRVRAVHGAAHLIGADRVSAVCLRISSTPKPALQTVWPALQRDLSGSIDDAWRAVSKLLDQVAEED